MFPQEGSCQYRSCHAHFQHQKANFVDTAALFCAAPGMLTVDARKASGVTVPRVVSVRGRELRLNGQVV